MGRISPDSSAMGMNCPGGIVPSVGWFQREQRFSPGDGSRLQINFGLVVQRQFVPFQGAPQILLDGFVLNGGTSMSRLKN